MTVRTRRDDPWTCLLDVTIYLCPRYPLSTGLLRTSNRDALAIVVEVRRQLVSRSSPFAYFAERADAAKRVEDGRNEARSGFKVGCGEEAIAERAFDGRAFRSVRLTMLTAYLQV